MKFKHIIAHQGSLLPTDPDYKGSRYNVLIEWATGETTFEPLTVIAKDAPVVCAIYAKEKGLLDTVGWKQFNLLAKCQKKLSVWQIKPSYNHFELQKSTSMDTKYHVTMQML